jgi:hypothetical protein
MDSRRPVEWQARMLRAWHLAAIRFAVTRDNADRLGVIAIAGELDGLGRSHERPDFAFFRRTSSELCAAILKRDETADKSLRLYLAQIDDARLKRALGAVLEIEASHRTEEMRRSKTAALWQGLPSRGNIRT